MKTCKDRSKDLKVRESGNEQDWCCDDQGNRQHWAVDDYQSEGVRETTFLTENVTNIIVRFQLISTT